MADEGEGKAAGTHTSGQTPTRTREQSEWTASDTRGPLSSAETGLTQDEPPIETATEADAGAVESTDEPRAAGDETVAEPAPATAAHEPLHEPTRASAARGEPRKSLPAVPIALAVIIGAIIGAGSAAAINMLGVTTGGDGSAQIASLDARVTALEKRPAPQADVNAGAATTTFDPGPLQQKVADLQGQLDSLKQAKGDSGNAMLDGKIAALGGRVDELKAQNADAKDLDGKVAALAATLDGLKKEDATTQGSLAALQDSQKSLGAKITSAPALAVVADSLVEAIARGRPYASQVAALGTLGADQARVAVLKENADKGVPSAQTLAQKFAPLADSIIAAANKPPPNAGIMDRLKSGVASMVSVRSAGAADGDDAGSRVSRIEADLANDDVTGAYATWNGLPPDAKAKTDAWGALAKTHVEAMDAARALQQQAIAALGGKKS